MYRLLLSMWNPQPTTVFMAQLPMHERSVLEGEATLDGETRLKRRHPHNASLFVYDITKWHDAMTGIDALLGSRIHDTMIALAAKTPAVLIAQDAQMHDLGAMMRVPMLDARKLVPEDADGGAALVAAIADVFDGEAFNCQRAALARRYREHFDCLGLELHLAVALLAQEAGMNTPCVSANPI